MQITEYYQSKINDLALLELGHKRKASLFPFIRLGVLVAGIALLFILLNVNLYIAISALVASFASFIVVAKLDQKNSRVLAEIDNLKLAFNNEIACKNGDFSFYPAGKPYVDARHGYTSDLDIFGDFSIFQFINRTTLKIGSDILASWLSVISSASEISLHIRQEAISSASEISLRQEAIKELRDKFDWRFRLYVTGLLSNVNDTDHDSLNRWLEREMKLGGKLLKLVVTYLPILTVTSVILSFFFLPTYVPVLLVVAQIIVIQFTKKEIALTHDSVTRTANLLMAYSDTLKVIENETYKSAKLLDLVGVFRLEKGNATGSLKQLARIIEGFDLRFSWVLHPVLNPLLLWDLHHYERLKRWKVANKDKVGKWIVAIGEFEALSSLGNLSFNNPLWVMPEISGTFDLVFTDVGHPLIVEQKRVLNDFTMKDPESINIVTGSNMAGKSTFLRTVGINLVLAGAGSCVCATRFLFTPLKPLTSMRVFDDMRDNASTFYAELKRLEQVLSAVKNNEKVFLLLDEILKGTNSSDRHQGSIALIKQLVKDNAHGIIATHDIALSDLATDLPHRIKNYHFDAMVENDELYFDYKIHDGVCQSFNASLLLRKLGLDMNG